MTILKLPRQVRLLFCLWLTAATLLVPAAPAQEPAAPPAPKVSMAQRVNEAIDRGMDYLLKQQDLDGSWRFSASSYPNGQTALCLYTLLKCGLPKNHPSVTCPALPWGPRRPEDLHPGLLLDGPRSP